MTLKGLKIVLISIIFLILLSSSLLLAHENQLLRNNMSSLQESLQDLEDQYKDLSTRYEDLKTSYTILQSKHSSLVESFEKLKSDYVELMDAYVTLNETYTALLQDYTILRQQLRELFELQSKYEGLLSEYQTLQASYAELRKAYERIRFAVYHPLWSSETVIPSISELKKWLAEDDTDKIPYSKWDFVCGDYALMLSVKAKMNRWDMGVVVVLGRDAQGNRFSHAFNAIRCVEGLVYVEPQNDQVFYEPISEGSWYYHPGLGRVYVELFIVVVPYQI